MAVSVSAWYPIAASVEDCQIALADLSDAVTYKSIPRTDEFVPTIHQCFDRLQSWSQSFDVDSYGLDRKLCYSPSLSRKVWDIIDNLQEEVKQAKRRKTIKVEGKFTNEIEALSRESEASVEAIDKTSLHIEQTKNTIELLFDPKLKLQKTPFPLITKGKFAKIQTSAFGKSRENILQVNTFCPAFGWKTSIIVNSTKTAQGMRWESLSAVFTQVFRLLSGNSEKISSVQFTQASDLLDEVYGLPGAIEHIRTNRPSDSLLSAAKFEKYLSSAANRLQETHTSHMSLIFIVPDGVVLGDLPKIQRTLLQKCKSVRRSNIRRSGLIITFALLEPSDYMLEPLMKLAAFLNRDCAVTGTMHVRVIPLCMLNTSMKKYEHLLRGGLADLERERTLAIDGVGVWQAFGGPKIHAPKNRSRSIRVSNLSPHTMEETISLEFGRIGDIESVSLTEPSEEPTSPLSSRSNDATPESPPRKTSFPSGPQPARDASPIVTAPMFRQARLTYHDPADAAMACRVMNLKRFDGEIIRVRALLEPSPPKNVKLEVRNA